MTIVVGKKMININIVNTCVCYFASYMTDTNLDEAIYQLLKKDQNTYIKDLVKYTLNKDLNNIIIVMNKIKTLADDFNFFDTEFIIPNTRLANIKTECVDLYHYASVIGLLIGYRHDNIFFREIIKICSSGLNNTTAMIKMIELANNEDNSAYWRNLYDIVTISHDKILMILFQYINRNRIGNFIQILTYYEPILNYIRILRCLPYIIIMRLDAYHEIKTVFDYHQDNLYEKKIKSSLIAVNYLANRQEPLDISEFEHKPCCPNHLFWVICKSSDCIKITEYINANSLLIEPHYIDSMTNKSCYQNLIANEKAADLFHYITSNYPVPEDRNEYLLTLLDQIPDYYVDYFIDKQKPFYYQLMNTWLSK
jgi:hypothetical protein